MPWRSVLLSVELKNGKARVIASAQIDRSIVTPKRAAQVFYSVATASSEDSEVLVSELNKAGLKTVNLSKNELAKSHVRFMGGGGSPIDKERFFKVASSAHPHLLPRALWSMSHGPATLSVPR